MAVSTTAMMIYRIFTTETRDPYGFLRAALRGPLDLPALLGEIFPGNSQPDDFESFYTAVKRYIDTLVRQDDSAQLYALAAMLWFQHKAVASGNQVNDADVQAAFGYLSSRDSQADFYLANALQMWMFAKGETQILSLRRCLNSVRSTGYLTLPETVVAAQHIVERPRVGTAAAADEGEDEVVSASVDTAFHKLGSEQMLDHLCGQLFEKNSRWHRLDLKTAEQSSAPTAVYKDNSGSQWWRWHGGSTQSQANRPLALHFNADKKVDQIILATASDAWWRPSKNVTSFASQLDVLQAVCKDFSLESTTKVYIPIAEEALMNRGHMVYLELEITNGQIVNAPKLYDSRSSTYPGNNYSNLQRLGKAIKARFGDAVPKVEYIYNGTQADDNHDECAHHTLMAIVKKVQSVIVSPPPPPPPPAAAAGAAGGADTIAETNRRIPLVPNFLLPYADLTTQAQDLILKLTEHLNSPMAQNAEADFFSELSFEREKLFSLFQGIQERMPGFKKDDAQTPVPVGGAEKDDPQLKLIRYLLKEAYRVSQNPDRPAKSSVNVDSYMFETVLVAYRSPATATAALPEAAAKATAALPEAAAKATAALPEAAAKVTAAEAAVAAAVGATAVAAAEITLAEAEVALEETLVAAGMPVPGLATSYVLKKDDQAYVTTNGVAVKSIQGNDPNRGVRQEDRESVALIDPGVEGIADQDYIDIHRNAFDEVQAVYLTRAKKEKQAPQATRPQPQGWRWSGACLLSSSIEINANGTGRVVTTSAGDSQGLMVIIGAGGQKRIIPLNRYDAAPEVDGQRYLSSGIAVTASLGDLYHSEYSDNNLQFKAKPTIVLTHLKTATTANESDELVKFDGQNSVDRFTQTVYLKTGDQVLFINACDGVRERTDREATPAQLVIKMLSSAVKTPAAYANCLVMTAFNKGSTDNISAMVSPTYTWRGDKQAPIVPYRMTLCDGHGSEKVAELAVGKQGFDAQCKQLIVQKLGGYIEDTVNVAKKLSDYFERRLLNNGGYKDSWDSGKDYIARLESVNVILQKLQTQPLTFKVLKETLNSQIINDSLRTGWNTRYIDQITKIHWQLNNNGIEEDSIIPTSLKTALQGELGLLTLQNKLCAAATTQNSEIRVKKASIPFFCSPKLTVPDDLEKYIKQYALAAKGLSHLKGNKYEEHVVKMVRLALQHALHQTNGNASHSPLLTESCVRKYLQDHDVFGAKNKVKYDQVLDDVVVATLSPSAARPAL